MYIRVNNNNYVLIPINKVVFCTFFLSIPTHSYY